MSNYNRLIDTLHIFTFYLPPLPAEEAVEKLFEEIVTIVNPYMGYQVSDWVRVAMEKNQASLALLKQNLLNDLQDKQNEEKVKATLATLCSIYAAIYDRSKSYEEKKTLIEQFLYFSRHQTLSHEAIIWITVAIAITLLLLALVPLLPILITSAVGTLAFTLGLSLCIPAAALASGLGSWVFYSEMYQPFTERGNEIKDALYDLAYISMYVTHVAISPELRSSNELLVTLYNESDKNFVPDYEELQAFQEGVYHFDQLTEEQTLQLTHKLIMGWLNTFKYQLFGSEHYNQLIECEMLVTELHKQLLTDLHNEPVVNGPYIYAAATSLYHAFNIAQIGHISDIEKTQQVNLFLSQLKDEATGKHDRAIDSGVKVAASLNELTRSSAFFQASKNVTSPANDIPPPGYFG